MQLGKLKEIDIRKVWGHEQYGFSAWLSKEENINELGDVLGLNLTDIQTEQFVGNYRCDIICKDETTNKTVLIENQLETTNHDHLGKIITYASGLDAAVIVWIVKSARDEHANAVEWLNKHTDDTLNFFLIEVHAYQIGDSVPAPQFKVIEQPNDFAKTVQSISKSGDMSESMSRRFEFWTMFNEVLEKSGKAFNKHKASTDHWYTVAVGSSKCHIQIDLVNRENKIRISLIIDDCKELYDELYSKKLDIESKLGYELSWYRLDTKKACWISTYINGLDFNNRSNYKELIVKTIEKVKQFKNVFTTFL